LAIYLQFIFDRDCSTERPGVAPRRSLEDQGVVGLGAGCFEGTGGFGSNGLRSSSRGSLGCGWGSSDPPPGVPSPASIEFKDEAEILAAAPPGQDAYLTQVLPAKMRLNLRDVQNFSIGRDLSIALRTVLAVARWGAQRRHL